MRSPAKVILYVIYAVVVVGLLTAIITSFHSNKASAPAQPKGNSAQSHTQPSQGSKAPSQAGKPQGSQTATPQGSAAQTPPPATQPAPAVSPNGQLNNTGPGDTIGLFLAATAAGAIVYRVAVTRKLKAD